MLFVLQQEKFVFYKASHFKNIKCVDRDFIGVQIPILFEYMYICSSIYFVFFRQYMLKATDLQMCLHIQSNTSCIKYWNSMTSLSMQTHLIILFCFSDNIQLDDTYYLPTYFPKHFIPTSWEWLQSLLPQALRPQPSNRKLPAEQLTSSIHILAFDEAPLAVYISTASVLQFESTG